MESVPAILRKTSRTIRKRSKSTTQVNPSLQHLSFICITFCVYRFDKFFLHLCLFFAFAGGIVVLTSFHFINIHIIPGPLEKEEDAEAGSSCQQYGESLCYLACILFSLHLHLAGALRAIHGVFSRHSFAPLHHMPHPYK